MITVFVEAAAGTRERGIYDEQTFERKGGRLTIREYPYPYGFVVGTKTEEGDAVDCYVVTETALRQGTTVQCIEAGLLEFFEDGAIDHKIIATLQGEKPSVNEALRKQLENFIYDIFSAYPDSVVRVGRLLSSEAAINHIESYRTDQGGTR